MQRFFVFVGEGLGVGVGVDDVGELVGVGVPVVVGSVSVGDGLGLARPTLGLEPEVGGSTGTVVAAELGAAGVPEEVEPVVGFPVGVSDVRASLLLERVPSAPTDEVALGVVVAAVGSQVWLVPAPVASLPGRARVEPAAVALPPGLAPGQ